MEESLKFNSQICTTKEQSQRLLELGLKPETADCMYSVMTKSYNGHYILEEDRQYNLILFRQEEFQSVGFSHYEHIPAWSLHRLLEILPSEIKPRTYYYSLTFDKVIIQYECYDYGVEVLKSFGDSPYIYDNIVDCIEWLIGNGYFKKEYLKQ